MPMPKRGVAFTFTVALVEQANRPQFKANPSLAVGDVKISKDNGALANITTLPTVAPASSRLVQVALDATEMTADRIDVQFVDAAGAEWDECIITINTTAVTVDDLVRSTTPANTLDVSAAGNAGIDWGNIANPTTAQNLSGTNIDTDQVVASVSGAVGSVTGAVGSIAAGGIAAAAFAAGAIDAAAIAANAIGASELAADAVTEIITGLLDLTDGIEIGLTPRQALRLMAAADAGKLSGAATTTVTIRNAVADTADRIQATVDSSGNRTAITYNLS